MAKASDRGSAESHSGAAHTPLRSPIDELLAVEESELLRKKENLSDSRARVLRELEVSQNPRYRDLMQKALADLDEELRRLGLGMRGAKAVKPASQDPRRKSSAVAAGLLSSNIAADASAISHKGQAGEVVIAHAYDTFGSREKARHWLHRPNHVFQGRIPMDVIGSDPQAVEIELTRIDHGVYI